MHRSTTILLLLGVVCLVGSAGAQPEGDAAFECLQNGPSILSICEKELALAQGKIALNQTEESSPETIASLVDELGENELPTEPCCTIAASFSDGQCLCQPILRGILPTVGVQIPAINSILKIMEQACGNFEIVECA
ncbi:hypothetical protein PSENEW3_00001505 [Picochlorum sp. SENEW3]|nr:hypothetical protein PSENEW3_00001505 [Picochlorum sp. SENEW3]